MFVKACLNGARRPTDHPSCPVTPAQLAEAGAACVAAGARALHLHPRDAHGAESLAAHAIDHVVEALRAQVGVPFGVSTGAWFLPDPGDRLDAIESWTTTPDFASVNMHEPGAVDIAHALLDRGIGVEAGLWHGEGARVLIDSGLAERCTRILLEPLVQDLDEALALVSDIEQVLDGAAPDVPRLLHGFGATAWPVLDVAVSRGYQLRIGLEDTLTLPDGSSPADNAALVAAALARADRTL